MPPVDIDATVIANTKLSREYSVLALAAPEVGARTQPGQFVMVKPVGVTDPLLRRPFSVFEVLRDAKGTITGISILNKRAGRSTQKLYDLEVGDVVSCLGPLGQPFKPATPPMEAWMVAGGVGLAPFATLAESLAAAKTRSTLFYGARSGEELFYLDFFERLGITLVLSTEDGSRGTKSRITGPLEDALKALCPGTPKGVPYETKGVPYETKGVPYETKGVPYEKSVTMIYACGPEPMLEAVAKLAARHNQPSQVSVERVMGCGLGGCYSCVVPVKHGDEEANLVRSCISGPVFDGAELVWD